MATNILSYATVTATQGGADTFVQTTITTGLANLSQGWSIREVLIEWGATTGVGINGGGGGAAASAMFGISMSYKSLTALALATDKATMFAAKRGNLFGTAVGYMGLYDKIWRFNWDEASAPVWVPDTIYVQNHSAGTAATLVANIRIGYEVTKVTDAQKALLLLAALQA